MTGSAALPTDRVELLQSLAAFRSAYPASSQLIGLVDGDLRYFGITMEVAWPLFIPAQARVVYSVRRLAQAVSLGRRVPAAHHWC